MPVRNRPMDSIKGQDQDLDTLMHTMVIVALASLRERLVRFHSQPGSAERKTGRDRSARR